MEGPTSSEVLKKLQTEGNRILDLISHTKSGIKSLSFMLHLITGTIAVYMIGGSGHNKCTESFVAITISRSFCPHPVNSSMVKSNRSRNSVP